MELLFVPNNRHFVQTPNLITSENKAYGTVAGSFSKLFEVVIEIFHIKEHPNVKAIWNIDRFVLPCIALPCLTLC